MRPLYLQSFKSNHNYKSIRLWFILALSGLGLFLAIPSFAGSYESKADNPMEDQYSHEIRTEFAKCREEKNPMTQYLCTCRVLAKQCEAPRRIEHGDWNTVEYWPSNNEEEREVQFILFASYDILGDYSPIDKGLVLTCMRGISDFNVFVGENINLDIAPRATLGQIEFKASFTTEDESTVLGFEDTSKIYQALQNAPEMQVTFTDMNDNERSLEFDTYGFDNVSNGWEKLCTSPSS